MSETQEGTCQNCGLPLTFARTMSYDGVRHRHNDCGFAAIEGVRLLLERVAALEEATS